MQTVSDSLVAILWLLKVMNILGVTELALLAELLDMQPCNVEVLANVSPN